MLQAILYVGHGSRMKEGNEQFIHFIHRLMEQNDAPIQQYAFLEKAAPTFLQSFQRCVEKGASVVTVVPIFLFSAGHVKNDLRSLIEEAKLAYPHVVILCSEPIGPDERVVNILVERLQEKGALLYGNKNDLDTRILLVGRGSSDKEQQADFLKVVLLFLERCPFFTVDYCFLAKAEPNFHEGLKLALKRKEKNVFVIPYLLFTGVLVKRMEAAIKQIRGQTEKNIVLTDFLGYHPNIIQIVNDRLKVAKEISYAELSVNA